MNDILLINLKRFGDIFSTAHLVNSYIKMNPQARISLLVFKEFEAAAKNIANISQVFTIDRKQILTYKKNDIFSDGFSIEAFYNQVETLKTHTWHKVINYSNDKISTLLTSYLSDNCDHVGIKFNNKMMTKTSSDWDIVLNDVLTTFPETPLTFVDTYHHMMSTKRALDGEKLALSTSHNESAFKNLNYIRKTESKDGKKLNIVGIQLFTSQKEKNIPEQVMIEFIEQLMLDDELHPILLIAPTLLERTYAEEINSHFNNKLVSVEADFKAIPSVLVNVDLLVTPDTAIKHIADLVDTPTLEISLGASPMFKQGTINNSSLILTSRVDTRSFSKRELALNGDSEFKVTSNDIYSCVNHLLNSNDSIELSKGISVYKPQLDNLGTFYTCIAGEYNIDKEARRLISRQVISDIFEMDNEDVIKDVVCKMFSTDLLTFLNEEKAHVTSTTKALLGTLRCLLQTNENKKKIPEFVTALDNLLLMATANNLSALPIIFFRSRIESLDSSTFAASIKEVEALLYELKSDIQKIYSNIKNIELKILDDKKERLQEKYSQSSTAQL